MSWLHPVMYVTGVTSLCSPCIFSPNDWVSAQTATWLKIWENVSKEARRMYAILMQCSLKKLVLCLAWPPPQNELKVLVSWTFRLVHCANGILLDLQRMNFMLWGEWFVGECRCVWRRLHTVYYVSCWKLSDSATFHLHYALMSTTCYEDHTDSALIIIYYVQTYVAVVQ